MSAFRARGVALAALMAIVATWMGCASPEKKVNARMDQLRTEWETNIAHQANLLERVVDWPTAWQLLLQNNLKLRQSRNEVTNTIENYRQVYKELIPTVNARAGVSKNLTKLNTISPDDV